MVTFINCFEVPAGRDEDFLVLWGEVNAYMAAQPGYVDHRLHRAVSQQARYRFVNVAHWDSADAWRAAHDDGFQRLVAQPGWAEFPPLPALFELVDDGAQPSGGRTDPASAGGRQP